MAGFIYRENRVAQYQRLYQREDGKRLWMKHPRSKTLIFTLSCLLLPGIAGAMYGMSRLTLGKKTFT